VQQKPLIIAEAADAHYGDLDRALAMVDAAKRSGADVIKFQHHIPDEEMLRDIPMSQNMAEPLYDFLVRNALHIDQHASLKSYCDDVGIRYLCTPFSLAAARELEEFVKPGWYKIGSGELTDIPTLLMIRSWGHPMIISTGMATVGEITATYNALASTQVPLVLMNCTSAYPPSYADVRLGFIEEMRNLYPLATIGHSDHTPTIDTAIAALALGCSMVEKHVTIDPALQGPDQSVSIDFNELSRLVEARDRLWEARGSVKEVLPSELEIRAWARRSLVYLNDFSAGHEIRPGDIWGKRPGTGVPSSRLEEFIGRHLRHSVQRNTLLHEGDLE
jgi:sialic acid synthase SpsE